MARCTLCGQEQYPFDSKQTLGKDGQIHWFCCMEHLEAWEAGKRAPEAVVETETSQSEPEKVDVAPEGVTREPVTPGNTLKKRSYKRKTVPKTLGKATKQ